MLSITSVNAAPITEAEIISSVNFFAYLDVSFGQAAIAGLWADDKEKFTQISTQWAAVKHGDRKRINNIIGFYRALSVEDRRRLIDWYNSQIASL
jgi:hypothetical protein